MLRSVDKLPWAIDLIINQDQVTMQNTRLGSSKFLILGSPRRGGNSRRILKQPHVLHLGIASTNGW